MKNSNQKNVTNTEDENQINWAVVGPIIAIILGTIVWSLFF
jgi:hypothetical protein